MQSADYKEMSKGCPDCGEIKRLEEFPRYHRMPDGRGTYCRLCHNRRTRESVRRNGGSRRYHLRQRYGLESDQIDLMISQQGGVCAVCRKRPATQVDHDHKTGVVRGILCIYCNAAMGAFRDNPAIISDAIKYLESHSA
jgi:hypothetical protein